MKRALVVVAALAACKGKPADKKAPGTAPAAMTQESGMVDHPVTKVDGPAVTPVVSSSITFVVPKDATWWAEMAFPCYAAAINLQRGQSVSAPFTQLSPNVEPATKAADVDLDHDIAAVGA